MTDHSPEELWIKSCPFAVLSICPRLMSSPSIFGDRQIAILGLEHDHELHLAAVHLHLALCKEV